jgi:hypothetical protein
MRIIKSGGGVSIVAIMLVGSIGDILCAGINRHRVENERVLHEGPAEANEQKLTV